MKRFQAILVIAVFVTLVPFLASCGVSHEDGTGVAGFSHVQVITYASGLTGFFDTTSGMLYIYDSSLEKCVFIRKINKLGDAMQHLRDPKVGG